MSARKSVFGVWCHSHGFCASEASKVPVPQGRLERLEVDLSQPSNDDYEHQHASCERQGVERRKWPSPSATTS
jgi:hypothetical protein